MKLEVSLRGDADLEAIRDMRLDVAGINRTNGTAMVIADESEKAAMESAGLCVRVLQSRDTEAESRTEELSNYLEPDEILPILEGIQRDFPQIAKLYELTGELFEGHKIYAMKITTDVGVENDRPSFIVDAQHHAREVMTPEIAVDMLRYLTSNYPADARVKEWVESVNIWVVPSVNPDGAAYVFKTDNWWRKNRRPSCAVDINRNYPFNWGICNGSEGICSSAIFRGNSPASEPETAGMVELFQMANATFGLTYHSFGEYILSPYGCGDPDDVEMFLSIGHSLNSILEDDQGQTGRYATGTGATTIYVTDGSTDDEEYGNFGTFAYCIEVNCCDFQPDYAQNRDNTVRRQRTAWQFFLDRTLDTPMIHGHIFDSVTGEPIEAEFSVAELPLTHGERIRKSDAKGRYFRITPPGRSYHLTFSREGYCSKTVEVQVGNGPKALDVSLSPSSAPTPQTPSPADGTKNQPPAVTLSWESTGASNYDLYLGTSNDPPFLAIVNGTSFVTPNLETGKTYFWRIGVSDECGQSLGPVWSFSTYPYSITLVKKATPPLQLVVKGEGFVYGCIIKVNGTKVPTTSYKSSTKLVAGKGKALKAMASKGSQALVTVEDERGGSSPPYAVIW